MTETEQEVLVLCGASQADAPGYEQLQATLTKFPHIVKAVAMPDLHAGPGIPIGACFVSQNHIYPGLIGDDIGCGMTLFATRIKDNKRAPQTLASKLTRARDQLACRFEGAQDLLRSNGLATTNFDAQLGSLGGGNHFAEFLSIDKILDQPTFDALHLCTNHLVLLVHSGSRQLGRSVASRYPEILDTPELQDTYLRDHDMAVEWALANRMLISRRVLSAVGASDGVKVLNIVHNYLQIFRGDISFGWQEPTDKEPDEDQTYFLHRKGVGYVNPGGVTVIPGSRGTPSYIVKMSDDVTLVQKYLCSVAHGAGRKWCRSKAAAHFAQVPAERLRSTPIGSTVVCSDVALLREEHSDAYKDVTGVIDDLVSSGLISVVAQLMPVCTFKN